MGVRKFRTFTLFCKVEFAKLKKNGVKCIFFMEKFGSMKKML